MPEKPLVHGIFSVYPSEEARSFKGADTHPIGLELVFHNDGPGGEFARRLQSTMAKMPLSEAMLFRTAPVAEESMIGFDCFFKNTDALRKALSPALDGLGLYLADQHRALPKTALFDASRKIMAARQEAVLC